jgi:hypothetical protein
MTERPAEVERALRFIRDPSGDDFESVALSVFAHQFTCNEPYRRLCLSRGRAPDTVRTWEEIPAVPTAAFKEAVLSTAPAHRVFATSGTSTGADRRGRHYLPDLSLYEAAWEEPFRRYLLPDRERMRVLSLIPSEAALPDSSLSYMVERALDRFGAAGSRRCFEPSGADLDGFRVALQDAVRAGEPVLLLGTAFAFAHVLDDLLARGECHVLPAGSRIMDTGGTKGRGREVSRDELLRLYEDRFGVPPTHVAGEYGMTEMCSQFYDPTLARFAAGMPQPGERIFEGPHWVRTRVLDPATLADAPAGADGLLTHVDLANAWTVSAIVTEDLGAMRESGFILRGRARGAELRGCSLVTEELLGSG